jgi:hypothetical protein
MASCDEGWGRGMGTKTGLDRLNEPLGGGRLANSSQTRGEVAPGTYAGQLPVLRASRLDAGQRTTNHSLRGQPHLHLSTAARRQARSPVSVRDEACCLQPGHFNRSIGWPRASAPSPEVPSVMGNSPGQPRQLVASRRHRGGRTELVVSYTVQ